MSVADIREGLAANLAAYFDGIQISAYELSNPTPPCFEIGFRLDNAIEFNEAGARGIEIYHLIVRGIVSNVIDVASQAKLDEWCAPTGASSVRAAIESDLTLGGAARTLQVTDMSNYRAFAQPSAPNVTFLAAEWAVTVYASGE